MSCGVAAAVSAFVTRSTPLGCSFDFACFRFGLALPSGISAGVVLSSLVRWFIIRYCLSLAHIGCLPSFGSSSFLLFAPPLFTFGSSPGSKCCSWLLRCPPPGLWPSSSPIRATLPMPMFPSFSGLSGLVPIHRPLSASDSRPRFSSLVLIFLVSVVSVLLLLGVPAVAHSGSSSTGSRCSTWDFSGSSLAFHSQALGLSSSFLSPTVFPQCEVLLFILCSCFLCPFLPELFGSFPLSLSLLLPPWESPLAPVGSTVRPLLCCLGSVASPVFTLPFLGS